MSSKRWPVNKPIGPVRGLQTKRLSFNFQRLERTYSSANNGYRFLFELDQPSELLVMLSAKIAAANGGNRAGYLTSILTGTPVPDPIASVKRIYVGQQYVRFLWAEQGYRFEFWPHIWITDYTLEIWARAAATTVQTTTTISENDGVLLFGLDRNTPEPFTFYGVPILFP